MVGCADKTAKEAKPTNTQQEVISKETTPVVEGNQTAEEPTMEENQTIEESAPVVEENQTVEEPTMEENQTAEEPTIEENQTVEESAPVVEEVVIPTESIATINTISIPLGQIPTIDNSTKEALNKLADFLKTNPNQKAIFKSYTDASGSEEYNLEISQKRADLLKEYLISLGVDASQVEAIGYGETNFVDPENPNSPKNRRIEVEISEIN